jgi:hypothetical protein
MLSARPAFVILGIVLLAVAASARPVAPGRLVWAGAGACRRAGDETRRQIIEARRLGVDGVILFSYDSPVNPSRGSDSLAPIGGQVFGQRHSPAW